MIEKSKMTKKIQKMKKIKTNKKKKSGQEKSNKKYLTVYAIIKKIES